MKKIFKSVLAALLLIATGCSKQTNNNAADSNNSNTGSVTNNIQVSETDRLMGLKYWEDFPENYSDLSNLYAYTTDEIKNVVVGTWNARNDYGATFEIEFTGDGIVSIVGTGKTDKSINYTGGKWEASVDQIIITDLNKSYDGYYYLCALQDDDHVLLFHMYNSNKRPSANPFLMERKK